MSTHVPTSEPGLEQFGREFEKQLKHWDGGDRRGWSPITQSIGCGSIMQEQPWYKNRAVRLVPECNNPPPRNGYTFPRHRIVGPFIRRIVAEGSHRIPQCFLSFRLVREIESVAAFHPQRKGFDIELELDNAIVLSLPAARTMVCRQLLCASQRPHNLKICPVNTFNPSCLPRTGWYQFMR